jgi:GDPmannose 4,6-dehydratase
VTGQGGSFLVEDLTAAGWEVHGSVRRATASLAEIPAGVVVHEWDMERPEDAAALIAAADPDVVFNLGGLSSVAASWENPPLAARVSGLSAVALLDAAWQRQQQRERDVRFIQASSSEIFGSANELPQRESTAIAPISPYGASKALIHSMVTAFRKRGMFATNAILYNHESPRRPLSFVTRKITSGVAAIAAGRAESITLGNLDARRDWGWAPDYMQALQLMADADAADDFIVASGESHTVREFVSAAFAAVGIDDWVHLVKTDPGFMRPLDSPEMCGDASKLRRVLGWAPTIGFPDIVASMVRNDVRLLETEVSEQP